MKLRLRQEVKTSSISPFDPSWVLAGFSDLAVFWAAVCHQKCSRSSSVRRNPAAFWRRLSQQCCKEGVTGGAAAAAGGSTRLCLARDKLSAGAGRRLEDPDQRQCCSVDMSICTCASDPSLKDISADVAAARLFSPGRMLPVDALDPFLAQTAVTSVCNMTSTLLWESMQNSCGGVCGAPPFIAGVSVQNFTP